MDFTKRFKRQPADPATGGHVAVQDQPPPDPNARVAPPGSTTPDTTADQTQQLDHTSEQPHYGGAAASRGADPVDADHDDDGVEDRNESRDERGSGVTSAHDVRARQRDEFGGFNWGSAFFGWLVAIGLGALLTAAISGAGAAIGLTDSGAQNNTETIGVAGGILLLIVAAVAYYCGGYVAGRMSRFDGARQGLGVWVFGLLATVAIAAAGWIFGDEYNLLDRLDLPRIPIDAGDLTTGGVIALAAIVLGTLVAAMAGGKFGQRYHNKIDRHGFGESRL